MHVRCWVVHISFVCIVELKFPAHFPEDHLAELLSLLLFWSIGLVGRVFVNGLGDKASIPGRVITKT